jgi:hypothetical protein
LGKITLAVGCAVVLLFAAPGWGLDIDATGDWTGVIDSGDLIGGAGTDLISTYTSDPDQGSVTITGASGDSDAWRVDVRRSDTTWHGNLAIAVKRTSDGTGGGSVSGGASYVDAGLVDAEFFSGTGNRSGVEFQLRLSGVSVQVPPNSYSTSIILTVVDM